jgi:hypothetical protein
MTLPADKNILSKLFARRNASMPPVPEMTKNHDSRLVCCNPRSVSKLSRQTMSDGKLAHFVIEEIWNGGRLEWADALFTELREPKQLRVVAERDINWSQTCNPKRSAPADRTTVGSCTC